MHYTVIAACMQTHSLPAFHLHLQDPSIHDVMELPLLLGTIFADASAPSNTSGVGVADVAQPVISSLNHTVINVAVQVVQQLSGPSEGGDAKEDGPSVVGVTWTAPTPKEPVGESVFLGQ